MLEGGQLSYFYDRSDRVCKGVISLSQYSVSDRAAVTAIETGLLLRCMRETRNWSGATACCSSLYSQPTWRYPQLLDALPLCLVILAVANIMSYKLEMHC